MYIHPLDAAGICPPASFTYPFRYTAHPLCRVAVRVVMEHLERMGVREGKMYGVLVAADRTADDATADAASAKLSFLAAYSGQKDGSYSDDWFVPPIVDYLQPDGYFMREQAAIVDLNQQISSWHRRECRLQLEERKRLLEDGRDAAVARAKATYAEGKARRQGSHDADAIRESQHQKADIVRARRLHAEELEAIAQSLDEDNAALRALQEQRKRRSMALQQWLFCQFEFLNARGETARLVDLMPVEQIPSGAGECCAPKLLQAAYRAGLKPLCMAEFWYGPSTANEERLSGEYYPACHRKCRPILQFMLQGLDVEPDPALYYDSAGVGQQPHVLWEDQWYAAIDKPAGWLSVQGIAELPCVEDFVRSRWPLASGPLIVHRLDQDTSGILLIAKTAEAHRRAQWLFEHRHIYKRYEALLERPLAEPAGTISLPLMPDIDNRPRQRVSQEHGAEAVTRYEVITSQTPTDGSAAATPTRVAFYPETGRTHQLRVHAASPQGLNSPICGDRLYGHLGKRLCLHATTLRFEHPYTHEQLQIDSPCPF